MCGIIGIKGNETAEPKLVQGLKRLVYRGYDSWGVATTEGTHKEVGEVEDKSLGLEGDTGIGHCLHPDTLVVDGRGRVDRIKEFGSENVKSFDFEEYKTCEQNYKKYSHEAPDEIYRIKGPCCEFRATGQHKIFVSDGDEIKTKRVKELNGDEFIASPSKIPHKPKKRPLFEDVEQTKKYKDLVFPKEPSKELLKIVGYHIGDGFISGNRTLRYKDADRELLEKYNRKFEKVFNISGNIHEREGHFVLNVNSKYLADWFKKNLTGALERTGDEKIPKMIYDCNLKEVGGLITGLFDAEGTVGVKSRQVSLTMTSEALVRELRQLLLKNNVLSTIYKGKREPENWSDAYTLSINNLESVEKFEEFSGFDSQEKTEKLEEVKNEMSYRTYKHSHIHKTQDNIENTDFSDKGSLLTDSRLLKEGSEENLEKLDSGVVWTRFDVEKEKCEEELVYDLEVEDTKSFYGGGVVQHNSRWATHGGVTKENAHPHESCKSEWRQESRHGREMFSRFAIVHNGIIENHDEFKFWLDVDAEKDHDFTSETDSEVVAHYLEDKVGSGLSVREALIDFHDTALGSYAVVVLDRKEEKLYALKNKSPLLLARNNDTYYFASDIYAVSKWSSQAYFMEDGDIIQIDQKPHLNMYKGEGQQGKEQQINWQEFEWTEEDPELGENDHWMEKEIREIPEALQRLENSSLENSSQKFENISEKIENSERVIFTGSGTSYHASLLGVYYLQKAGVEAQTLIASEFENYERVTEETTVIALSQSGETRDVLNAIEHSKGKGAEIVSITNVPHSTIERKSDLNIHFEAHQENCVAATKTFTNQLATMMYISNELGAEVTADGLAYSLSTRIEKIRKQAMEDAGILKNEDDIYILGSGITYPLSREIALKLKEISYKHAEGMMAGELKHGTLALVEEGTPVIALNQGEMDSSIKEVESRGGEVINKEMKKIQDKGPQGDWESEELYLMRTTLYGFWLTYYLGKYNKLPIDRPRNLAKSVTVG